MIRDPFYRDIVAALNGRLDPELFEQCAADLLRDAFPTLVPIRGGSDAGMDGAIADDDGLAYPLVSTIGKEVIRNLTRSLDSYLSKGGDRKRVVLATSQELSGRRRRNLQNRAKEKSFELVQIFDQAAFADRLYRSPPWCRELLNLTGAPAALSAVPLTRRPLLGTRVVGREAELSWLRESCGDRLLIGPSGSGKTFLLHSLAREGWGLFLVIDDLSEVAGAIRSERPEVVIVDDAHLDPERLNRLRQLREEIGGGFSIVATAWEGEHERVAEPLILPDTKVRRLELLGRDRIVEVVEESGVRGPLWLVKEIVDQAEGKPGLAVTLSQLCLRGGVREVALGEHLRRHTVDVVDRSIGPKATQVLAAFALGGDAGMSPSVVSRELGLPTHELYSAMTRLSVGGVVDKIRHDTLKNSDEENLTVRPPNLRYALVRDVFFGDGPRLPHRALTNAAPDASEVARTLVRSAGYGASIPQGLLVSALEHAGESAGWDEYALLGPAEAEWVLHNHPEFTIAVARPALMVAPKAIIPRLLDLAVGDERPLNQHPEHPLRLLEEWVSGAEPGTNQAVPRRELLVEVVATWLSAGGDESVGTQSPVPRDVA
jgi:hypothetical protein